MKTEVKSTEYKDGQRIDVVEYTYTQAEDYVKLGQLYCRLGQIMNEPGKEQETAALQMLINAQYEYIKGYGDENAADPAAE